MMRRQKKIMTDLYSTMDGYVQKMTAIFEAEGAVIPAGFSAQDVYKEAPVLYENGFDIMCIRLMEEISMGMHTLHINMSARQDIVLLYKDLTSITQECYNACTQYLLEKGLYAKPPYTSMPQSVEFVKKNRYFKGTDFFSEKRALNVVEVAHIIHIIEANIIGMKLITGFAQSAQEPELRMYFLEGKELAKSIIHSFSELLLQSDIQPPATSGGNVTTSLTAPFSDKLMIYSVSLLCGFSLGSNALGTAFTLRNDLPAKATIVAKDVFEYAHKGAKLMIKHGWMEQPPQMPNHEQLSK
jgi:hypothetical protein